MSEPTPTELLDHAQTLVNLRERIAAAIIDEAKRRTIPPAWPAGPGGSGATMHEIADAVMAVVQPELDRRATEIAELQQAAATAHDIATDRRCLAREAMHRAEQAEAAVVRVKALAANATRTGCGAGWDLNPADILAAFDQPAISKES